MKFSKDDIWILWHTFGKIAVGGLLIGAGVKAASDGLINYGTCGPMLKLRQIMTPEEFQEMVRKMLED